MADTNDPRSHRAYDPQRSGAGDDAQRSGGGDPLAELARLIGQTDPFAEFERARAAGEPPRARPAAPPPQEPAPETYAPPPYGEVAAAPSYAQPPAPPHAAMPPPFVQGVPADAYAQYPDPAYAQGAETYPQGQEVYYDPYYDPDGNPLDEAEYHEQQQRKRRRRRLAAVIAILALAVVGGAGAYGYRSYVGQVVRALPPPPVIKAEPGPSKVMPVAQAADSASNKLIYDRVGESNQAEKVVPREEKPVDIKTATVSQPPRSVYPSPDNVVAAPPPSTIPVTRPSDGAQVLPVASAASAANQGNGAVLPSAKKIRTVTIRPDMTVASTPAVPPLEPAPRAIPAAQSVEAPPPPRTVPAAPAPHRSAAASAPSPAPAIAAQSTPAPARAASPPPPSSVQAPPPPRQTAAAPLSLSPSDISAPAPRAPARTPASAPQSLALANTPAAAPQPRSAGDGSFMVQVSSQRSEADAKASFKSLQARYPNVLGGREPSVRRADLGDKGVYYRSMVGPFANGEQAVQFCSTLKAAGGQCIIHRN